MQILLAAHLTIVAVLYAIINKVMPDPYMDEIFHIPQAQRYCLGDWKTWDPKLTTPPGLYMPSALLGRFVPTLCTIQGLRLAQLGVALSLIPVLYRLRRQIQSHPSRNTIHEAIAITTFPLVYFYAFMYYTDLASLASILLSYSLAMDSHITLSAIAGLVSLTFRQTNIIWVAFVAVVALTQTISDEKPARSRLLLRNAKPGHVIESTTSLVEAIIHNPLRIINLLPYAGVAFAFLAFVKWNGGIVLGDKSNHVATLHLPMIFYFTGFSAVFLLPQLLRRNVILDAARNLIGTKSQIAFSVLLCGVGFVIVNRFTFEHPFLLADNRHYPFYVWRKIYKAHWSVRYLLVPGYLLAASSLLSLLRMGRSITLIQTLVFVAAACLTLIPTPLIEPRYFIIPFILLRLHAPKSSVSRLNMEIGYNMIINAITIYLFIAKPFKWPTENGWQRFMW